MGDAGFGFLFYEIEDRCPGRFGACACGGGDGDERMEGLGNRQAFAKGCVDEVKEGGTGEAGV